jgi:hypothetical protein
MNRRSTLLSRPAGAVRARRLAMLAAMLACSAASAADRQADPAGAPRDAAERVQEGSVRNWIEYYQREYTNTRMPAPDAPKPADTPDASGAHQPPSPAR